MDDGKTVGNNLSTEPLWTVEEVASYLRLSPTTVRAMARRGDLPGRKVGRVWRFVPQVVKNFICGQEPLQETTLGEE